jgi:ubiquinone/menaquinone biosynthesis C-methylase UbiE
MIEPPGDAGNIAILANIVRFDGLAETYNAYRPHPPEALLDILTQLAQVKRPGLVVDLGSGTGLSTWAWAGRADRVVGIEPNEDMRHVAKTHPPQPTPTGEVRFLAGLSAQTGLPDASADIVTCAQSLHWMDPSSTLKEAARILRAGGVFAAYDYQWPPTILPEAEIALDAFQDRASALEKERSQSGGAHKWPKAEHMERMRQSGYFHYVKEFWLHNVESGDAQRLVGLGLSMGSVNSLLRQGVTEEELGVGAFRAAARRILGDQAIPWIFSYQVRVGIKPV